MQPMVTLTFGFEPEDDQYVALCPELDIASQGDTIEDAAAHLKSAVILYLDTMQEDGELGEVFRTRGIRVDESTDVDYDVKVQPGVFATVRRLLIRAA